MTENITSSIQNNKIPKAYLYRQVVEAKLYIEANYAKNIDLNEVSSKACFSKYHFLRLFKESFGLTPNQFLISVRLNHAKSLLKSGHSVQDCCWSVGFGSVSSFSTLFKKKFGTSPTKYAQAQKEANTKQKNDPLTFIPGCFAENYRWNK